jgi:hydrogenase nickel incorporation protein HypA/HybF
MHELAIAEAVLGAIRTEAARHNGARVCRALVRIGDLSGVNAEAFRFSFEAIVRETALEPLSLEIEICPRRHRCTDCSQEFAIENYNFRCPQCRNERGECIGGEELELAYIEVEEYATS